MQLEGYSDVTIKEKQAEINSLYDNFSKKYGRSIHRRIREPLIRTAVIVCCVLWKNLMMKAISKEKQICLRSVPLKGRRLSQAWILQVKRWQYL